MIRFLLHPPGWPVRKLRICRCHWSALKFKHNSVYSSTFLSSPPGGGGRAGAGLSAQPAAAAAAAAAATAAVAQRASGGFSRACQPLSDLDNDVVWAESALES